MAYESHWTGEVRISPPLTWAEIKNSPVGFQDVKLRLDEQVEDTPTSQIRTVTAEVIVPLTGSAYSGYAIEEELRAFVEAYGAGHTVEGRIEAIGPDGDRWAYVVGDGVVTRVEPVTVWPGSPVPAAVEQHIRQQIARELFAERITETPAGWSERYVGGWNDALDAAVDKVRAGGQQ